MHEHTWRRAYGETNRRKSRRRIYARHKEPQINWRDFKYGGVNGLLLEKFVRGGARLLQDRPQRSFGHTAGMIRKSGISPCLGNVPDYAAACCMTNKFKAESCESLEVLAILETGQPPRAVIPRSRWAGRLPPMLYLNQRKSFRACLIMPEGWFTPAAQKRSPSSDLTGGAAK